MYFSNKARLLFVAAPKTGSTSVERLLERYFPDGKRFVIELGGRRITSVDVKSPSLGHATAAEFRKALGSAEYGRVTLFGFVRDPIEKVVSSYFFTRSSSLRRLFFQQASKYGVLKTTKSAIRIISARLLPLSLWSLLYPMRSCSKYFTEDSGKIIVEFLGSTERLEEDLTHIMRFFGVKLPAGELPHIRRSAHRDPKDYPLFRFCIPLLRRRYRSDVELFEKVKTGLWRKPKMTCDRIGAGAQ